MKCNESRVPTQLENESKFRSHPTLRDLDNSLRTLLICSLLALQFLNLPRASFDFPSPLNSCAFKSWLPKPHRSSRAIKIDQSRLIQILKHRGNSQSRRFSILPHWSRSVAFIVGAQLCFWDPPAWWGWVIRCTAKTKLSGGTPAQILKKDRSKVSQSHEMSSECSTRWQLGITCAHVLAESVWIWQSFKLW